MAEGRLLRRLKCFIGNMRRQIFGRLHKRWRDQFTPLFGAVCFGASTCVHARLHVEPRLLGHQPDTRLLQLHCIDVMKSMPIRIQLTWQVLFMSAQSAQMSQRVFIAGDGRRCDGSCLRHHKKYHLTDGDSKSSRTIHEGHSTPTKSNQRRKLINGGMSSTWSVALNDDINTKIQ